MENLGFEGAFNCIPINMADDLKKEIMQKLHWSEFTFRAKKKGLRGMKQAEKIVLAGIFEEYDIKYDY